MKRVKFIIRMILSGFSLCIFSCIYPLEEMPRSIDACSGFNDSVVNLSRFDSLYYLEKEVIVGDVSSMRYSLLKEYVQSSDFEFLVLKFECVDKKGRPFLMPLSLIQIRAIPTDFIGEGRFYAREFRTHTDFQILNDYASCLNEAISSFKEVNKEDLLKAGLKVSFDKELHEIALSNDSLLSSFVSEQLPESYKDLFYRIYLNDRTLALNFLMEKDGGNMILITQVME